MKNGNNSRVFRVLIDTCVWLDLARDYKQQPLLTALEELIRQGDVSLVLPRVIVDEFARNKTRVIEESGRSLSGTLRRVKEVVEKFGDPRKKHRVLQELSNVDHRIPTLGSAAVHSVGRIENLFAQTPIIEISDAVMENQSLSQVTKLLQGWRYGNSKALDTLLPLV
jgi:hypothetical protein